MLRVVVVRICVELPEVGFGRTTLWALPLGVEYDVTFSWYRMRMSGCISLVDPSSAFQKVL
jgi:hypothetical protein